MDSVHGTLLYAGVTGNMAFISSEIRTLGPCKTPERVRNWLQKNDITSRQIGWKGWPINVAMSIIFGRVSEGNARWEADVRSVCLLNDVPSWTYSEVILCAVSRLPEYCVNQNDEPALKHSLCVCGLSSQQTSSFWPQCCLMYQLPLGREWLCSPGNVTLTVAQDVAACAPICPVMWLSTLQPVYHDRRTGAIHDSSRPAKNTHHRSASPVFQKYAKIK